jgi:hypothetical protein
MTSETSNVLPREEDIDNDVLIEEIEQRAPLYKKDLKEYSDIVVKKRLWEEICGKLFPDTWERMTGEQKTKTGKFPYINNFILLRKVQVK